MILPLSEGASLVYFLLLGQLLTLFFDTRKQRIEDRVVR